jgi:hypothetical protein
MKRMHYAPDSETDEDEDDDVSVHDVYSLP